MNLTSKNKIITLSRRKNITQPFCSVLFRLKTKKKEAKTHQQQINFTSLQQNFIIIKSQTDIKNTKVISSHFLLYSFVWVQS